VSRVYLDTSAAAKLLIEEPESAALARWIDEGAVDVVGAMLVETELRRIGMRLDLPQADVTALLEGVTLYEMPPSLFREAGVLPGASLRSLDALHLAAALRLDCEAILTYDERLTDAAFAMGMPVRAPR
jgi:predicted nucleic acid-binding protein